MGTISNINRSEAKTWKKVLYGANIWQRCTSIIPGTVTAAQSAHPKLVTTRAQFIVTNEHLVPEYHILKSNCECLAVWCKTGQWATVQASSFLRLFALAPAQTSLGVSAQLMARNVMVTAPQSGIWGMLGYTTTTEVSLISTQPWLLPVIGVVNTAVIGITIHTWHQIKKHKEQWREIEKDLEFNFWSSFWELVNKDIFNHICSYLIEEDISKMEENDGFAQ